MRHGSTEVRRALLELERVQAEYGGDAAARKSLLLRSLDTASFGPARDVQRYHECLCWLRAYPDDKQLLAEVERQLTGFARRADLRRHRTALESSGIAGTDIRYAFYADTARWFAREWPDRLEVEWKAFPKARRELLEGRLGLLAHHAESPAMDEGAIDLRQWINLMRGPGEADGGFLGRAFGNLADDPVACDHLQDEIDVPMVLRWGEGGPSRTLARLSGMPVTFQRSPLRRARPDLWAEIARPPRSIRAVSLPRGRQIVNLARRAMVTRDRDLDAFIYGDPRDVRLADCGDGLVLAVIGMRPDRRLMLESVYSFLTLKNGVPIGYVLTSAIFNSSEIAYNVFDTFRGGEAAHVYGRVLALTHALFGTEVFTIFPYQLGGEGNEEGLKSGAWWFYQKLGFRPRERRALRLMQQELARMRSNPRHRSSIATLKQLAAHNVFLEKGRPRVEVMGALRLDRIGLAATRYLTRTYGGDRRTASPACADDAARLLNVRGWRRWPAGERLGFRWWSPLILALPGVARWSAAEKRAAASVMRAKGGRRESDFVRLLDTHRPLRVALARLAAMPAPGAE